jgi:GT2 family glycosyltransferase
MQKQVDLLVVNYNTKDLLKRLVDTLHDSIDDHDNLPWKLYISDNGSTDGSIEMLREWCTFPVRYNIAAVVQNENVGYAKAINHLASISNSEFLCAVNADTWFTTNHVREVIDTFNENLRIGVVGVKQMDEEKKIRHGGIFWDGETNPIHRSWAMPDPNDYLCKDIKQCWTVSGSICGMG